LELFQSGYVYWLDLFSGDILCHSGGTVFFDENL
jgi:hypothetical protein